jgi:hypothetical protein
MLTHEQLKELLHYDPETGVFTTRVARGNLSVDRKAGCKSRGYIQLRIADRIYRAHRLAWFYVHGSWPDSEIDHINLVTSDNRIANLREATRKQNTTNTPARRNNRCGKKGVTFAKHAGKWRARIVHNGRPEHLGYFTDIEAAHAAYAAAARVHFGEFARVE